MTKVRYLLHTAEDDRLAGVVTVGTHAEVARVGILVNLKACAQVEDGVRRGQGDSDKPRHEVERVEIT